jgi:ketosteroid isomerase-like protein
MDSGRVRETAEAYFAALRRFDLEAVAACFTDDAFYSHPPYDPDQKQRAEAVGGAAIVEMLRAKRGPRPVMQEIRHCLADGEVAYLEGVAYTVDQDGGRGPVSEFLSSVRVNPDGRFRRYISYVPGYPIGRLEHE